MKTCSSLIVLILACTELISAQRKIISPRGCFYDDNFYPVGKHFKPDDCTFCTCQDTGEPICAMMDCAAPQCHNPTKLPGQCCPVCTTYPGPDDGLPTPPVLIA